MSIDMQPFLKAEAPLTVNKSSLLNIIDSIEGAYFYIWCKTESKGLFKKNYYLSFDTDVSDIPKHILIDDIVESDKYCNLLKMGEYKKFIRNKKVCRVTKNYFVKLLERVLSNDNNIRFLLFHDYKNKLFDLKNNFSNLDNGMIALNYAIINNN